MGQFQSKLKCIYRLAQSGKTQLVKDIINDAKEIVESFGETDNTLHLFISANNMVLAGQTSTRFENSFCWVSSNPKEYYEIITNILDKEYSILMMCSNSKRFQHLSRMINRLEQSSCFMEQRRKINIWIDEADVSINLWKKYESIAAKEIIEEVTLISATFDSVRKKYTRLQVIGYKDPHPQHYKCLRDSIKIENNFAGGLLEYIEHNFEKYPKLIQPGMRAFIPGTTYKSSHNAITDLLVNKYNFAVLIINGERKEIVIPNKSTISLIDYLKYGPDGEVPDEFKEILAKVYLENKLYEFPFAITGLECIKRGITFQSNSFLFDYGIIPHVANKAEAYQLIARLFGNIGDFPNYKPCEIYSSFSNFKKIEKQEAIAMNISTMVYERNLPDVGIEEFNEAQNMSDTLHGEENAKTFKELKKLIQDKYSMNITKRAIHENSSGILVSTTYGQPVLPVDKNSEEYKNYDYLVPTLMNSFKCKSRGSFLSSTRPWVVVPVYNELVKDTEVWYCRFKK